MSKKSQQVEVKQGYTNPSFIKAEKNKQEINLMGNVYRKAVHFCGKVKDPILFRELLSVLYEVVKSDYRYIPKDRTSYLLYQRLRRKTASMQMWQARQAYFDWLFEHDPTAFLILDPVISVYPDKIIWEVFSKDEGSYASISMDQSFFETKGKIKYGTTNIDYTENIYKDMQQLRSFQETWLNIDSKKSKKENALEKKIQVPESWIRGFFQVQSAATLPQTSVSISPVELYNILRYLRFHKDRKKGGRAIRIELTPGQCPQFTLEPWEETFTTSKPYQGEQAYVLKIWGRRRLLMLRRLLPYVEEVKIHLLGSGLPSFFSFQMGPATFTLGITGFTSSDWTRSTFFDLLLPREFKETTEQKKVISYLEKKSSGTLEEISKGLKIKPEQALKHLQLGCQKGLLMYDFTKYRLRYVVENVALDNLQFRNQQERLAYDLIANKQIVLECENYIWGTGVEIVGKVVLKAEKSEFRPLLLLSDEKRLLKGECTCDLYRKHGLKEGPCPHLIALHVLHTKEQKKQKNKVVETCTYSKRSKKGEEIVQIILDNERLKKRWGLRNQKLRVQNMFFNSTTQAQQNYQTEIVNLQAQGFLEVR